MGLSTNIGLRALLTSQSALDTIGQNVANANTEGYSRQRVQIASARPLNLRGLQLGHGAQANNVIRSVDELLNGRILRQNATLGRLDAQLTEMQSIEALIDEPGSDGFGALLDGIFENLSSLSANTEDLVARTGVVQASESLIGRFRQVSGEIDQLQRDARVKARSLAQDVNVLSERIVGLNAEITQTEAEAGVVANDLRDQRDLALRQLSQRIDIEAREDAKGVVQVQVGGQLLVGARSVNRMTIETDADGEISVQLAGGVRPVEPSGGEIAGLVEFSRNFASTVGGDLDTYARTIARELNRAHSTGVPLAGGFDQLRGTNAVVDVDGDGDLGDALLRDAGLPFDVEAGELYVHVVDQQTGALETERIAIDPDRMTVQAFLDAVSDVPALSARLDSFGRVNIDATAGSRFYFGRPIDTAPDRHASFGGGRASTVGSFAGPFSMSAIQTIDFDGASGPFSVSIDPQTFQGVGEGTATEVAEALNGDASFSGANLRAVVVGQRIAIQTLGEGAGESFEITGGSALTSLGLTAGTFDGQDLAVDVTLSGTYTGAENHRWTFVPLSDGVIGTTPGLEIAVRDENGGLVGTLDVGAGYAPGNAIEVADGLSISFTVGEVSATDGDAFATEVIADSDTSDVLVGFGLNAFLTGTDATTIDLREDIRRDPRKLAASSTGAVGDGGALLDMIRVQSLDVDEVGGTLGEFYGTLVGDIGFEIGSTQNAQEIESFLLDSLEAQREEVSGVNVDEELVRMIQFEQSYQAAAQFLQVVNQLNDTVLALV